LLTVRVTQVDKGNMDDDDVKMVPQWRAKEISPVIGEQRQAAASQPPSKEHSTLKTASTCYVMLWLVVAQRLGRRSLAGGLSLIFA